VGSESHGTGFRQTLRLKGGVPREAVVLRHGERAQAEIGDTFDTVMASYRGRRLAFAAKVGVA